jgi:hypothetical protein
MYFPPLISEYKEDLKMVVKKDLVEKVEKTIPKKVRKLDDNTEVTVISNFSGLLYYISPRTQDEFEWAEFGDEHDMSIKELKSMKAQHRRFFEDKWIVFAEKDQDVISHLKLDKYYKDGVKQDDLEDVFTLSLKDIEEIIETATPNEKSLILTKAREQYDSGELVNTHIIKLIEDKLQVDIDVNNPK